MEIGSTRLTSSGNVDSTNATRIYAVIVKSDGTAASVQLLNGGSSGTEYDRYDGKTVINQAITFSYPGGLLLASGAYLTMDAHATYCTVIYERE